MDLAYLRLPGQIRTVNLRSLEPSPLPIGLQGDGWHLGDRTQYLHIISVVHIPFMLHANTRVLGGSNTYAITRRLFSKQLPPPSFGWSTQ